MYTIIYMKPSTVYNDYVSPKQKPRKTIANNNVHQQFHFIKVGRENKSEQQAPCLFLLGVMRQACRTAPPSSVPATCTCDRDEKLTLKINL